MGDKFLLGPLKVFPLFHRHSRAAYILHDTAQHTHTILPFASMKRRRENERQAWAMRIYWVRLLYRREREKESDKAFFFYFLDGFIRSKVCAERDRVTLSRFLPENGGVVPINRKTKNERRRRHSNPITQRFPFFFLEVGLCFWIN